MSNGPTPESAAAAEGQSHSNATDENTTLSYPKPEVDYQEIVENPDILLQKLQSFHSFFDTKFRVPTVGGNALDLHRLFVEVTSRGGIEKVVRDRRWKEITGVFKFPSSITSASFVLRKYYLSLLYHFEQVYYFRKEERSISVPDYASRFEHGSGAVQALEDAPTLNQSSEIAILESGSMVTGTIDAKFDNGYLVTVDLGTEKLKGMLYHTITASQTSQNSHTRDRKRHQHGRKDPSQPKPNRSGYNFFFSEHYARLKPLYQGQEKSTTKKIGFLWNRLSEAEKQVYQEKGVRDKERYRTEMLQYSALHLSQA